jgi:Holliday junction resolvase-like predicted endonuclease
MPSNTGWIGAFGEDHVAKLLRSRGYQVAALQTRSGHGIDIVAIKVKNGRVLIIIVEVKATTGGRAASLRGAQVHAAKWARSRLERAIAGKRGYAVLPPAERALAQRVLTHIDNGVAAAVVKCDVTGVGSAHVETYIPRFTRLRATIPAKPTRARLRR